MYVYVHILLGSKSLCIRRFLGNFFSEVWCSKIKGTVHYEQVFQSVMHWMITEMLHKRTIRGLHPGKHVKHGLVNVQINKSQNLFFNSLISLFSIQEFLCADSVHCSECLLAGVNHVVNRKLHLDIYIHTYIWKNTPVTSNGYWNTPVTSHGYWWLTSHKWIVAKWNKPDSL